jgi:hypothetical protein
MKSCLNLGNKRIDWSVNYLTITTNMKELKNNNSDVLTEQLKSSLVRSLSAEYAGLGKRLIYQTVNEAWALASETFAPLLLLPVLAEEKVQKLVAWSAHQRAVRLARPLAVAA